MIILRDNNGNIIGQMESEGYVSTRSLRKRHEQSLCDKAMGIDREEEARQNAARRQARANRRLQAHVEARGLEMPPDGHALSLASGETFKVRSCNCEDYPCCGH